MPKRSDLKMTDSFVRSIRPDGRRRVLTDGQTRGLELHVSKAGFKVWFFWYRPAGGGSRRLRLGDYPALSLYAARQAAIDAARRVATGEDPQADRIAERRTPKERLKPVTVGDLWETYAEQELPQKRPTTIEHYRWLWEKHVGPAFASTPLADLDRASIRALVRKVGTSTPTTANRCLALVKGIMSFAVREELLAANPAAGLAPIFKETSRDYVITDDQIRAYWKTLDRAPMDKTINASAQMCAALRLAVVTATRGEETVGIHTREIDIPTRTWNLPADRTKQKRPQTVPLNARAWEILCDRLGDDPEKWGSRYVFPKRGDPNEHTRRHSLTRALAHVRKGAGLTERFINHDWRRTCATYIIARGGFHEDVATKILGHRSTGPKVTQIYMRHSYDAEKRRALDTWLDILLTIVGEQPPLPDNVTPIRPASGM